MRDIKYRDEGRPEDLLQELGYETQDIAYKKFTKYGAAFFAFFVACILLGFFFMWLLVPTKLAGGRMSDVVPKVEAPAGTPLLQSNITVRTDIRSLRQKESEQLHSLRRDDKTGAYHIPIDKAIDAVAKSSDAERAKMGLPSSGRTALPLGTNDGYTGSGQPGEMRLEPDPVGGHGG